MVKSKSPSALKAEWRNIVHNPAVRIALVVLAFVPIIYSGFFVKSIWDPYGNTSHLPVAIVNEDAGAQVDGQAVHFGDDLVHNLSETKDLEWHFISADDAQKGINEGKYYLRLDIPKNFSTNIASITTNEPAAGTLTYTVTPAKNYVASLMTTQASERISAQLSESVRSAYVHTLLENITVLTSGITDAATGATQLNDGLSSLQSGASQLSGGLSRLKQSLPTEAQVAQMSDGLKSVSRGLAQVSTSVSTPNTTMVNLQHTLTAQAGTLASDLTAYSTALQTAAPSVQAAQTAVTTAVQGGQSTVTLPTTTAASLLQIVSLSQTVAADSSQVLTTLSSLTSALTAQQTQLSGAITQLNSGMLQLEPNVQTALAGYNTISAAAAQLLGGSTQVAGGVSSAQAGSGQLASGLQDAAHKLQLQPTGEATAAQLVQPITLNKIVKGDVPNYGYALSPYVISLSLFVGAIAFNVIYPARHFFARPKNAIRGWGAKLSVFSTVAIAQALIVCGLIVMIVGLQPDNPGMFVLNAVMTSFAYLSLVTLLVAVLGNVGRFLSIVLLILQLTSAAGIFPIMLSGQPFEAFNPLMPMTYSVEAFRTAISSGFSVTTYWGCLGVLAITAAVSNVLLVLYIKLKGLEALTHTVVEE